MIIKMTVNKPIREMKSLPRLFRNFIRQNFLQLEYDSLKTLKHKENSSSLGSLDIIQDFDRNRVHQSLGLSSHFFEIKIDINKFRIMISEYYLSKNDENTPIINRQFASHHTLFIPPPFCYNLPYFLGVIEKSCNVNVFDEIQTIQYINKFMNNTTNNSKRGWLVEEDQLLLEHVANAQSDKLKWVEVARVLYERLGRQRTGKQCRERWQHQLNPSIIRDEWTDNEQLHLFELQAEYGNKWAQIAEHLPGRTDNAVKNFFYSGVRRVFTKVNLYLTHRRNLKQFKSIREFETDFLSKLMAVVDGNYSKKIRLTNDDAVTLAKQILANVAVLSINNNSESEDNQESEEHLKAMVIKMHDFRKSCKKRKQRKNSLSREELVESEEEPNSSKSITYSSQPDSTSDKESKRSDSQGYSPKCEMRDEKEEMQCRLLEEINLVNAKKISQSEINTSGSIELNQSRNMFYRSEPRMFKIVSGIEDRKSDKWWEILEPNQASQNPFRMEEESGEWEWKEENIFSLGSQREDLLGSSQHFGSEQGVTKFKMLEASLALEDSLLNMKKSSRFEQQQLFSGCGLGI